jgi:hypothetical protein
MEKEIINGELITTTKQDFGNYLTAKKAELVMLEEAISDFKSRANVILEELEGLVVKEEKVVDIDKSII